LREVDELAKEGGTGLRREISLLQICVSFYGDARKEVA
jgi:hypothetical protein